MDEKFKLTNSQLQKIQRALKALDGVVEGGAVRRFDYTTDTRWSIVKNQVMVDAYCARIDKYTKELLTRHDLVEGEALTAENRDRVFLHNRERDELYEKVEEIELIRLDVAALEEKNQKHRIPPSVLADLFPILDGIPD